MLAFDVTSYGNAAVPLHSPQLAKSACLLGLLQPMSDRSSYLSYSKQTRVAVAISLYLYELSPLAKKKSAH